MWAKSLHKSIDEMALKHSKEVRHQHVRIKDGTRFLSGKDYILSCKLRIKAIPTKFRMNRRRGQDTYILQNSHRTNVFRTKRHDAVTNYLVRNLKNRGFAVTKEKEYKTSGDKRKPDITAIKIRKFLIIDAQIGDQINIEHSH